MTATRRLASPALGAAALLLGGAAAADGPTTPGAIVGIPRADGTAEVPTTLAECVASALRHNASLEAVRLRREELRGQGWRARATGLPSIDLLGTWTRSRDPSFLLDESFGGGGADSLPPPFDQIDFLPDPGELQAQSFWRSNLFSEWELNPFRFYNAVRAVGIATSQYEEDVRAAEHQLAEETIRTFHEIVLHDERAAALDAEIEERREFLDVTRRRFELELATALDTLQAAVALANVVPERRRARKDLFNAASRLNLLMGRDARTPVTIRPEFAEERVPLEPAAATEFAMSRPDLKSVELQIEFLRKQRAVFRADALPSVSANGSYGYVARTVDDLVARENDFWQASVSLRIPLFDGFETKGRVIETEATISETRKNLVSARQLARVEVAVALEELEAAWATWDAARLNLDAAQSARDQVSLRYELGQADYLDFLNAQSERLAAESLAIEARYEVLVLTAALKRALGVDPLFPLSRVRETLEGNTP